MSNLSMLRPENARSLVTSGAAFLSAFISSSTPEAVKQNGLKPLVFSQHKQDIFAVWIQLKPIRLQAEKSDFIFIK